MESKVFLVNRKLFSTISSIQVLFIASDFIDYTGYIILVSYVVNGNSKNPYFTVKLKVDVNKYKSVCMMLFKSSAATPGFFESKRQNTAPIILVIGKSSNCKKWCPTWKLVVDALNAVNYKVDNKTYPTIQEIQSKECGIQYVVTACLR